jgi:nucleoside-diphosphate-sugar epimerase
MKSLGLRPIIGDITQPETIQKLPQADTVLFAVGMDRSRYSDIRLVYVDGLQNAIAGLGDQTSHLIYISSTGVYGDFGGQWIDETVLTNPTRDGGKACVEAEQRIAASRFGDRATILRFAGIYGPGRVPTRSLIEEGKWKKLSPNGYLNLIHVDDGAGIVELLSNEPSAAESSKFETFNVSDGAPPLRREYYEFIANQFGVDKIPWDLSDSAPEDSRASSSKRVSNRKLVQRFPVQFAYPDFQAGLTQALKDSV